MFGGMQMSNFEEWDIDTLRVRYKELEEENESLVRQYEYQGALMVNEYFSKEQVFKHFIPISVIQNKINTYKKAIEEEDYENLRCSIVETDIAIGVLQELLDLKE